MKIRIDGERSEHQLCYTSITGLAPLSRSLCVRRTDVPLWRAAAFQVQFKYAGRLHKRSRHHLSGLISRAVTMQGHSRAALKTGTYHKMVL